jgi:hypothetical protein
MSTEGAVRVGGLISRGFGDGCLCDTEHPGVTIRTFQAGSKEQV